MAMKEYYLCVSDQWFGPMSLDKLRAFPVSKDMFIWWSGLPEWKKVGDLRDQEYLFQTIPPPVKDIVKNNKHFENDKRKIITNKEDVVLGYEGLSSFLFYTSIVVMSIAFLSLFGYTIVLLIQDKHNFVLFVGSLIGLLVFAIILCFISLHYKKKSLSLRDEIYQVMMDHKNEISFIYIEGNGVH
jgi:hypothetical protein